MTKNRRGNNKNGLGIIDLMTLPPALYKFTLLLIQLGLDTLARKILDIK